LYEVEVYDQAEYLIPETSSVFLLLAGFGGLLFLRKNAAVR